MTEVERLQSRRYQGILRALLTENRQQGAALAEARRAKEAAESASKFADAFRRIAERERDAYKGEADRARDLLRRARPALLALVRGAPVRDLDEIVAAIDSELDGAPAECRCDLRTKLVGDGCAVCNPELAAELADDVVDAEFTPSAAAETLSFQRPA